MFQLKHINNINLIIIIIFLTYTIKPFKKHKIIYHIITLFWLLKHNNINDNNNRKLHFAQFALTVLSWLFFFLHMYMLLLQWLYFSIIIKIMLNEKAVIMSHIHNTHTYRHNLHHISLYIHIYSCVHIDENWISKMYVLLSFCICTKHK